MTEPKRLITTEAGFGPPVKRGFIEKKSIRLKGAYHKSRGVLAKPGFLKLVPKLATGWARPSPLAKDGPVMFVATHHKSMTTYFSAVLKFLGMGLGIPYEIIHLQEPAEKTRLFLSAHGKMDLERLRPYRGVHILRDPRDMIVSGYHYHKWTDEDWVHRPDDTGRSYQQKLLAANQEDGLFMEINHFIFFYRDLLEQWDMDDPDMLEVSYEALMDPEREKLYEQIFTHLGFEGEEHAFAVHLMHLFAAENRKSKTAGDVAQGRHVRSGKSGQWKTILTPDHLQYIEEELGPVLRKFGY